MKRKGFTVIELLVVIVVIGILASIAIVSYMFLRDDADDAKIRSTVSTIGKALALYESQEGRSSLAAIGASSSRASALSGSLVPKYLNEGFYKDIYSSNTSSTNRIIVWRICNDSALGSNNPIVVYGLLSNPTSEESAYAKKVTDDCSHTSLNFSHSGDSDPYYNYAQVF